MVVLHLTKFNHVSMSPQTLWLLFKVSNAFRLIFAKKSEPCVCGCLGHLVVVLSLKRKEGAGLPGACGAGRSSKG